MTENPLFPCIFLTCSPSNILIDPLIWLTSCSSSSTSWSFWSHLWCWCYCKPKKIPDTVLRQGRVHPRSQVHSLSKNGLSGWTGSCLMDIHSASPYECRDWLYSTGILDRHPTLDLLPQQCNLRLVNLSVTHLSLWMSKVGSRPDKSLWGKTEMVRPHKQGWWERTIRTTRNSSPGVDERSKCDPIHNPMEQAYPSGYSPAGKDIGLDGQLNVIPVEGATAMVVAVSNWSTASAEASWRTSKTARFHSASMDSTPSSLHSMNLFSRTFPASG